MSYADLRNTLLTPRKKNWRYVAFSASYQVIVTVIEFNRRYEKLSIVDYFILLIA